MRLSRFVVSAMSMALAWSSLSPMARADEPPIDRGLGQKVAGFSLPDVLSGEPVSLDDLADRKAVVLVFTGIDCPIGNLYMPRLVEFASRYRDQGVALLAINSNVSQGRDEIAAQAREFALNFPMLRDEDQKVADALQADRTCEALVIDAEGVLRYRGAIDDQYGVGFAREAPQRHYLADAVDAVLAGREIDSRATSVFGCPIERPASANPAEDLKKLDIPERVNRLIAAAERVRPASSELIKAWSEVHGDEDALIDEVGSVTYSKDVAPILQAKCQGCHRPGEVGPFTLMNFEEVNRRLTGIQEVVDLRRMPPWHADPRYGHFVNDRSLSPRERATILAWIEQGGPEGDPADLPEPRDWPEGWTIGTPDMVIQMPEPYAVKADGFLQYQRFPIKLNFKEDRWIQAAEARPSDRSVVHHIIAYLIPAGDRRPDIENGHLCGYAPGDMPTIYPIGTAKKIPAGSNILLEVHYTPNGKVRFDQSQVGLIFAKEPVEREGFTRGIANQIEIPPGDANYTQKSRETVPEPMDLLAFMPHMHLRGKAFKYELFREGHDPEVLLNVPAYDFGWQSYYTLAEPRALERGDRIICTAVYDNSEANPVNPDPTATVTWGDQTWDEMLIGYVDVSKPLPRKIIVDSEGRAVDTSAE